jgi:allantoinase
VIRAARAVLPAGERAATIVVAHGRITDVLAVDAPVPGADDASARTVRFGPEVVVLPGLVDTHVHLQDPGRDGWEGFLSGTRAAAAGGVTTLVDMPLDSLPVTTSVEALGIKRDAARGRTQVDVEFWGGAVPGSTRLGDLLDAGCVGVKGYLCDSGLDEFPPLSPADLEDVLAELAAWSAAHGRTAPLAVHAEDPAAVATGASDTELTAVATVVRAARRTGGRAHVVHVSSADAADLIAAARQEGLPVSGETCPHYLTLCCETQPAHAACSPPVRDGANQDRLWAHLRAGTLGCVVSDHSPSPGDVPGIASLELGLPVVWTAARARGVGISEVVTWMASGPADLVGLGHKGRIARGAAADLCVFAPEEGFTVDARRLVQRQKRSPYDGARLFGVVRETWRGGVRLIPET